MVFSKQFRALARTAGFFAGTWATVGAVIGALTAPSLTGDTALSGAIAFALMYGTVGAIAGCATALLVARAETGRMLSEIPTWRLAFWGAIGGMAPAVMFGLLGLIAGAPLGAVIPLLSLGIVGGGFGGFISGSASAAAKRAPLTGRDNSPRLPNT